MKPAYRIALALGAMAAVLGLTRKRKPHPALALDERPSIRPFAWLHCEWIRGHHRTEVTRINGIKAHLCLDCRAALPDLDGVVADGYVPTERVRYRREGTFLRRIR